VTALGIPVTVRPTFPLLLVALGIGLPDPVLLAVWVAMAALAVLAHEAGHALALRMLGSSAVIVLHGLGGATTGTASGPRARLLVSLAGPAAGLVLAAPLLVVHDATTTGSRVAAVVDLALWATLGWSVVNLVPVLPLDGGRAVAAGLSLVAGRDVTAVVGAGSVALACAIGVITLANGFVAVALLCVWLAATNAVALLPGSTRRGRAARPGRRAGQRRRSPAASGSAIQMISSAAICEAGARGSPAATRDSASRLADPTTVTNTRFARPMPA
jgi:hypothetical protein